MALTTILHPSMGLRPKEIPLRLHGVTVTEHGSPGGTVIQGAWPQLRQLFDYSHKYV
jgi:hypothetical protein